jgi:hypothetical protein
MSDTVKKILTLALALVAVVATTSESASNLNLSKSNINRMFPDTAVLVAASTTLSGPKQTRTVVYTTPTTGDFILTQVCTSPVNGGIRLDASNFGGIAHVGSSGSSCQTFTPGVILPKAAAITCTANEAVTAGDFCMITGVLVPAAVRLP